MNEQDKLRNEVKRIRWMHGITYRYIATNICEMNYRSFINFIHQRSNLGLTKRNKLIQFIKSIDQNKL